MKKLGKIIIYYGKGEGKTSASLGRAIREAGYGKKVIILQFMKGRKTGEYKFLKKVKSKTIKIYLCGLNQFLTKNNFLKHKKKAQKCLALAQNIIKNQKCDLLILDEILYALKFGLLKEKDILELLKNREEIDMILTGGFTLSRILKEQADQISEIIKIKHYFNKKQKAIKGLDY